MARNTAKRMTINRVQLLASKFWYVLAILVLLLIVAFHPTVMKHGLNSVISSSVGMSKSGSKILRLMTWNIAAINNNPFEYWITSPDPAYNALMEKVSAFILDPKDADIPVSTVFTQAMFDQLIESMNGVGIAGLEETKGYWLNQLKDRKIISEFIKDPLIGKKRLASMPDRVTNTISTGEDEAVMRPTVINCYNSGDLDTIDSWWKQYRAFLFQTQVAVKKSAVSSSTYEAPKLMSVYQLFSKISRSKYPSLTVEEEAISVPLQIVAMAIFDAILVHMMNTVSASPQSWQAMRTTMCRDLNRHKADRIVEILANRDPTTYVDSDVVFLQEVAGNFAQFVGRKHPALANAFDIIGSELMDPDRDQNSFILLQKGRFRDVREVTSAVNTLLAAQSSSSAKPSSDPKISNATKSTAGKAAPVVKGDLLVLTAVDAFDDTSYILASFHGDTNGLATRPVLEAVYTYATTQQPASKLLFGMDANTYTTPEKDQYGAADFAAYYRSKALSSCYGDYPNIHNYTTFHARTHLQPQLNKAITFSEKQVKGDKNPKDYIVFFAEDYEVLRTYKDNTGTRTYFEDMVFPTLSFPSDHGITSTVLRERPPSRGQSSISSNGRDGSGDGRGNSLRTNKKHRRR